MKKKIAGLLALCCATAAALVLTASVPQNLDKALDSQRMLVDERPGDAAVLNDYANLLMLSGRSAEAETVYLDALAIEPESAPARFNLALLLQRRGKSRMALDEYRKVFELQPDHAWAAYQIGSIHEANDDDRRAIDWYARAFSLDSRLFLEDYNPQVIDNRLVERAMLAGNHNAQRTLPPRIYEEPARIRRLLVDLPEGVDKDESLEEYEQIDPVDVESSVSRVLETGDLDDKDVNQATRGAGNSRSSNRRFNTSTRSRVWNERPANKGGSNSGGTATQRQGGSTFRGGSTTVIQPDTGNPTNSGRSPRTVRPRGGRPLGGTPVGTASTGRLEIDWMPEEESSVLPG